MIIPEKLKKGDTVAIVSLSSGMGGDEIFRHRYELGKERLEKVFGLNVITMPNALKGSKYLYEHPEERAKDLMDAFKDKNIKAIISMIGGEETIRLIPYIDYEIIKDNPKIFMGYSDTTVNHFMMYKAGVTSYYGPAILSEFAENGKMFEYTEKYIWETLFKDEDIVVESSREWTNDRIDWTDKEKSNVFRKMNKEEHGYEVLQGNGIFEGELLGGCLDVIRMIVGTDIWPKSDEWKNKILFIETSEEKPTPDQVKYALRNLVALGVISNIKGIIVGKPKGEMYYEEYKSVLKKVICEEAGRKDLPILYNVNFGHSAPMCILPYGVKTTVDMDNKKIIIKNSMRNSNDN